MLTPKKDGNANFFFCPVVQIAELILEFNLQRNIVSDNENQREKTHSYIENKLMLLNSIHV
jgi:hypothetical protein